jgi:hypothetical protein
MSRLQAYNFESIYCNTFLHVKQWEFSGKKMRFCGTFNSLVAIVEINSMEMTGSLILSSFGLSLW